MKPISIMGGGLAGLTLGIGLRQRGVPVTIHEAGHYPRHRVCGEFISGRGQVALCELGLLDMLETIGVRRARTAAMCSANRAFSTPGLTEAALCLPRFKLDAALAEEFTRRGGELRCGERCSDSEPVEGLVRATGRRAQNHQVGWRWFGLKAHARNVALSADLELHLGDRGYVGLCFVDHDTVNVCGLFRRRAKDSERPHAWRDWLRGEAGTLLHARLADAAWDKESFCAVAGLSLQPQPAAHSEECRVGDAITMIPPFTGNGMSMAFESAALAVGPLADYARGKVRWREAQRRIAAACDERFARRLRWAGWTQHALLSPMTRTALLPLATRTGWLWRFLCDVTR
jgi:2-polyprenyl-6-methoxyphenol hydroxylase-like FAD-dependent oxidoreductase